MSAISGFINTIQTAVYGEQVRTAIVNALEQCYSDVNDPSLNTEAFQVAIEAAYEGGLLDIPERSTIAGMINNKIIYRYTGSESGYVRNALYYYDGTAWRPIGSGIQTASTAAQMTDNNAIYKYTGTESGYSQNALYYYNGTKFVPITDVVEKMVSTVQGEVDTLKSIEYFSPNLVVSNTWTHGKRVDANGEIIEAEGISLSDFIPVSEAMYSYVRPKNIVLPGYQPIDLLSGTTWTDDLSYDENGNEIVRDTLACSDFIPVVTGTTYTFRKTKVTDAYGMGIFYFDSNKTFVSRDVTAGTSDGNYWKKTVTLSNSNIAYVRIMAYKTAKASSEFFYYESGATIAVPTENMQIASYDKNKALLSLSSDTGVEYTYGVYRETVPTSAVAYVRLISSTNLVNFAIFVRSAHSAVVDPSLDYHYKQAHQDVDAIGSVQIITAGKDISNGYVTGTGLDASGSVVVNSGSILSYYIRVPANITLTVPVNSTWNACRYAEFDKNKNLLRSFLVSGNGSTATFTTSDDCYYVRVMVNNLIGNGFYVNAPNTNMLFDTHRNNYISIGVSSGGSVDIIPNGLTSADIQAAIDQAVSDGGGVVSLLPNATYTISETVTLYTDFVSLRGNGAKLNAVSVGDGVAIRYMGTSIIATESEQIRLQHVHYAESYYLIGDSDLNNYNSRTGTGILCKGTGLNQISNGFYSRNVVVAGFQVGIDFQSQSWVNEFHHCLVTRCDIGTRLASGFENYGEKICFLGGSITGCKLGAYINHQNGTFQFVCVSFDYNDANFEVVSGRIYCANSHLETTRDMDYWFKVSGGLMLVRDSVFYGSQSNYGLISGTGGKVILLQNTKETWSMPANNYSGSIVEEWI